MLKVSRWIEKQTLRVDLMPLKTADGCPGWEPEQAPAVPVQPADERPEPARGHDAPPPRTSLVVSDLERRWADELAASPSPLAPDGPALLRHEKPMDRDAATRLLASAVLRLHNDIRDREVPPTPDQWEQFRELAERVWLMDGVLIDLAYTGLRWMETQHRIETATDPHASEQEGT